MKPIANLVIKIGTRGSKLALWQARNAQKLLHLAGHTSEIKIIKTKGDKIQNLGFDKMEGKGFFTKEIEEALLSENVDLAIHSLKDLPTESIPGLTLGGLSARANPADILIIHAASVDESRLLRLQAGAIVGTSSIRRECQLKSFDSSLQVKGIRGNVPTRIEKLRNGDFDAIVLAAAGIERLEIDLHEFHVVEFNPTEFVPAPGQGVIAYQCRKDDIELRRKLKAIHNSEVAQCTNVERKILQLMQGGCQLPLGAYCYKDDRGNYHCCASFGGKDQQKPIRANLSQSTFHGLAERIVDQLNN